MTVLETADDPDVIANTIEMMVKDFNMKPQGFEQDANTALHLIFEAGEPAINPFTKHLAKIMDWADSDLREAFIEWDRMGYVSGSRFDPSNFGQ